MKIKIMALLLAGTAGVGSSYALANDGNGHQGHARKTTTGACQKVAVFGTASGPQSFTVTVGRQGWHSSLAPGQVVTVTVGQSGQPVRLTALGCLNGSSVTARSAVVAAAKPPMTTTGTTTTATTTTATTATTTTGSTTTGSTTTTSTNHVIRPGGGKGGGKGGHNGRRGRH